MQTIKPTKPASWEGYKTLGPGTQARRGDSTRRNRRGIAYGDAHYAYKGMNELVDRDDPNRGGDAEHNRNMALSTRIWEVLQLHYPGHPWGVGVSHRQGVAQIFMPTFTQWSYVIRLSELKADPGMKMVVRGAGEMLERFNLPRSGFSTDHYVNALREWKPAFNYRKKPPGG